MTTLRNREGIDRLAIAQPWGAALRPATTTVIRARNEARSLPWVLPGVLRATDHVVFVDNLSDDGTAAVAVEVARAHGLAHRLSVHEYPVEVSRCGPEHLATPPDSVHSLVWFYEWSFAQVSTSYALKWDGDMVLTADGERLLSALSWQLPGLRAILHIPRHSLYVESERIAYLDLGLRNGEPFGYPVHPDFRHVKALEWELRLHPQDAMVPRMPPGAAVELKWLDQDEFSHWTDPTAFADSGRTQRKRREWQLVEDLRAGRWADHAGVHRVEAPDGVHVIDHVTQTWLPQRPRPLHDPEALR